MLDLIWSGQQGAIQMLSEFSIYIVAFGGAALMTGFTCLLACVQDDDDSQLDE